MSDVAGKESSDTGGVNAPAEDRRTLFATGLFGALMFVAAVFVVVDALRLPETSAVVGPAAVPLPVGVVLGAVGAGLLVQARVKLATAVRGSERPPRAGWRVVGLVASLVAFAVLLPVLGYVISAAGLFAAAAVLLGAPHWPRMIAYGWALAALVFLAFDRLIGLTLPTGPWGF